MVWPTVGAGVWPIALLFAVMPSEAGVALSLVVILWTLLAGGRAVMRIGRAQPMPAAWWMCEMLTGAAILAFGASAVWVRIAVSRGYNPFEPALAVVAGFATLLLAGTTHRHWVRYHVLANWARMLGRDRQADRFTMLALLRTGYEAVWLLGWTWLLLSSAFYTGPDRPDANLLLGLAVAIGALGFGVIWIWAVIEQALLERATR